MTISCDCCAVEHTSRCVLAVAPSFSGTLGTNNGGVPGPGANQFTFPNFLGSGVTMQIAALGGEGIAISPTNIAVGPSPPRLVHCSVAFSAPVYLRSFGITDLDFPGLDEQAGNFAPQRSGVYGQKINQACGPTFPEATPLLNPLKCVKDSVVNGTGGVLFPAPLTTTLDFDVSRFASGAGHFWTDIAFDTVNPFDVITLFRCISGDVWYDTAGNVVNPANYLDCEAS